MTSKKCPLAELLQLGDSLNQNREVQHGLLVYGDFSPTRREDEARQLKVVRILLVSFEGLRHWLMREGWCGDNHLIIFAESEVDPVSERYAIPALLPGYRILGLRGWDDFIVQANRSYSIPTVPLDLQYLSPFNIPPDVKLLKDERFEGKIKWYIKPVVFGGDPRAEDNIT